MHEPLAEAARSPLQWERLTAIDALTRMPGDHASELLAELRGHEDSVTARAAREAR